MSLAALLSPRQSTFPHQRSPAGVLSPRGDVANTRPFLAHMARAPRIETVFRRAKELPRDPTYWVDQDLLSFVRLNYSPVEASPLSSVIEKHKLTPRALWYLQDSHEQLSMIAEDVSLKDTLLELAESVQPAVSPTTPRIRHVRRLSEDLLRPPPPSPPLPMPSPPPEESVLQEEDDIAESVVSEWALDEDRDLDDDPVPVMDDLSVPMDEAPGLSIPIQGLGLHTGEERPDTANATDPQPKPTEVDDLINFEDNSQQEPQQMSPLQATFEPVPATADANRASTTSEPSTSAAGHVPYATDEEPSSTTATGSADQSAASEEPHTMPLTSEDAPAGEPADPSSKTQTSPVADEDPDGSTKVDTTPTEDSPRTPSPSSDYHDADSTHGEQSEQQASFAPHVVPEGISPKQESAGGESAEHESVGWESVEQSAEQELSAQQPAPDSVANLSEGKPHEASATPEENAWGFSGNTTDSITGEAASQPTSDATTSSEQASAPREDTVCSSEDTAEPNECSNGTENPIPEVPEVKTVEATHPENPEKYGEHREEPEVRETVPNEQPTHHATTPAPEPNKARPTLANLISTPASQPTPTLDFNPLPPGTEPESQPSSGEIIKSGGSPSEQETTKAQEALEPPHSPSSEPVSPNQYDPTVASQQQLETTTKPEEVVETTDTSPPADRPAAVDNSSPSQQGITEKDVDGSMKDAPAATKELPPTVSKTQATKPSDIPTSTQPHAARRKEVTATPPATPSSPTIKLASGREMQLVSVNSESREDTPTSRAGAPPVGAPPSNTPGCAPPDSTSKGTSPRTTPPRQTRTPALTSFEKKGASATSLLSSNTSDRPPQALQIDTTLVDSVRAGAAVRSAGPHAIPLKRQVAWGPSARSAIVGPQSPAWGQASSSSPAKGSAWSGGKFLSSIASTFTFNIGSQSEPNTRSPSQNREQTPPLAPDHTRQAPAQGLGPANHWLTSSQRITTPSSSLQPLPTSTLELPPIPSLTSELPRQVPGESVFGETAVVVAPEPGPCKTETVTEGAESPKSGSKLEQEEGLTDSVVVDSGTPSAVNGGQDTTQGAVGGNEDDIVEITHEEALTTQARKDDAEDDEDDLPLNKTVARLRHITGDSVSSACTSDTETQDDGDGEDESSVIGGRRARPAIEIPSDGFQGVDSPTVGSPSQAQSTTASRKQHKKAKARAKAKAKAKQSN